MLCVWIIIPESGGGTHGYSIRRLKPIAEDDVKFSLPDCDDGAYDNLGRSCQGDLWLSLVLGKLRWDQCHEGYHVGNVNTDQCL